MFYFLYKENQNDICKTSENKVNIGQLSSLFIDWIKTLKINNLNRKVNHKYTHTHTHTHTHVKLKSSYIQVRRPIRINNYHLKGLHHTYSKNNRQGAAKYTLTKKRKDIKLLVICSEIPCTQIPPITSWRMQNTHETAQQLEWVKKVSCFISVMQTLQHIQT